MVPAERWQRAAGWLIDVTPFVAIGFVAVLEIQGPAFVWGLVRGLLGLPGGRDLPSLSEVLRAGSPDHHMLGALVASVVVLVLLAAGWVVYRVIATARYGRTLGKWLVGSAVVRVDDPTRRPSIRQSWTRFLVPQASGWLPLPGTGLLPYLALCVHPRRRGVHDQAAGTIVVKAEHPHLPRPADPPDATDTDPRQSVGESS
ncbi:MAG: resuscitation-promoting factor RpfA [Frankiaceae bacterium]|nr:resuscitation-promoting factor RpfA [Frankiaceae bacterium]